MEKMESMGFTHKGNFVKDIQLEPDYLIKCDVLLIALETHVYNNILKSVLGTRYGRSTVSTGLCVLCATDGDG